MTRRERSPWVTVVLDAATDELAGLHGALAIVDRRRAYTFDYSFVD